MSSTIKIVKECIFCEQEFIAKTVVTKYCSHRCNSRHYKKKKRDEKLFEAKGKNKVIQNLNNSYSPELNSKLFLNIKETSQLIGISERSLFRMIKLHKLKSTKLGSRRIIKRTDIDNLFNG